MQQNPDQQQELDHGQDKITPTPQPFLLNRDPQARRWGAIHSTQVGCVLFCLVMSACYSAQVHRGEIEVRALAAQHAPHINNIIKAAEQGVVGAQVNLGIMFRATNVFPSGAIGDNGGATYNKTIEWYEEARARGFADEDAYVG